MNVKRVVFAILIGGLVLTISISRAVVDTSRIETVKGKNVLTQQDLQIIDDFMEDAVNDIVRTTNFTEVAKTRTIKFSLRRASLSRPSSSTGSSGY